MKKTLLAVAVTIFCLLTGASTVRASHIMGGELTYHWMGNNDYQIVLTLYRDCIGIPAPSPTTTAYVYSSCGANMPVLLNEISNTNITPACDLSQTCIVPNTSGSYGVEKHTYTGIVTLPGTCSDYTFYWAECCRNAAITNLVNASNFGATFYATLDNTSTPFNNSPVFSNDPVLYLFAGQTYHINNGMYDVDGDSLVISLIDPIDANPLGGPLTAAALAYNPPFSFNNPVTSTPALTIDANTGEILVTPSQLEVDVWAYKVDEYRNGIKIGSVTRDVQLIVVPGTDQLPELSGVNNYPGFVTTVCAGDSLNFLFTTSDADTSDSTSIAWHYFGQPNYMLSISAGQHESGLFTWATDSTMISPEPYLLYVSVKDNACPYYGLQTYVYKIYVNQCITNDVWPGDANSDLSCDMYDILPIGVAYGSTGAARSGASLNWVAQPCTPWANTIASGVNQKHADCDGNGVVDSLDLTAITLNFSSVHNKNGNVADPYINGLPDLFINYSINPAPVGSPVTAYINLGNTNIPMSSVYGISYSVNYDPNMFALGTMNFNSSSTYLGNNTNLLKMVHGIADYGKLDIGMVRFDHNTVNGNGEIARLDFTANPLIQGDVNFNMSFSNVRIITSDGSIIPVNVVNQNPLTISQLLSVNDLNNNLTNFSINPNQVKDLMNVDFSLQKSSGISIEFYNMIGKAVNKVSYQNQAAGKHHFTVNTAELPQGTYLVRLVSDNGVATQRMIKL